MRSRIVVTALAATLAFPAFAAVPPQVINKTITVSYTHSGEHKNTEGQEQGFSAQVSYTINVSSSGHPFVRWQIFAGKVSRSGEGHGYFSFHGSRLVGVAPYRGGRASDHCDLRCQLFDLHGEHHRGPLSRARDTLDRSRRPDVRSHLGHHVPAELFDPERQCICALRRALADGRSELGFRTDKSYALQGAILTLRGREAWLHDYNPDRSIGASFLTLPGAAFSVTGARQPADALLSTASAEIKWLNGWSIEGLIETELARHLSSYAGKGVVRYQW